MVIQNPYEQLQKKQSTIDNPTLPADMSSVNNPTQPIYNNQVGQGLYKPGIGTTYMQPAQPNINTATTPTVKTASDIYAGLNFETPEEKAFRDSQAISSLNEANQPISEEDIRKQTMARFQSEIDALNRLYAEKKQEAQTAGLGRLGSLGAVQARRGLLGSDFGGAQQTSQEQANQDVLDSIEAERAAKESSILSQVRNTVAAELEAKTKAKKQGAEAYLKFISEAGERRKNNTQLAAKALYEQGIEGQDLKSIADTLGVSVEALKATYNTYKTEADAAKSEAQKKALEEAQKSTTERLAKEANTAKTLAEIEALKSKPTVESAEKRTALEKDLALKGYNYVATPAERDNLIKQGYTMYQIDGRTYAKTPVYKTETVGSGKGSYKVVLDEKGNVVNTLGKSVSGGSGVPTSSKGVTKEQRDNIFKNLSATVGEDGKVSPQDYNAARKDFIEAGGTSSNFDTIFKGFKNPQNKNY